MKQVQLLQWPYMSDNGLTYEATGYFVGEEPDDDYPFDGVTVYWDIKDFSNGEIPEDEQEMCDWDKSYVIINDILEHVETLEPK